MRQKRCFYSKRERCLRIRGPGKSSRKLILAGTQRPLAATQSIACRQNELHSNLPLYFSSNREKPTSHSETLVSQDAMGGEIPRNEVNPAQKWSGRLDSNQRPHAPQACALPGCATSRPSEHNDSITSSAYHSDSRTVNKERSESRRSSRTLRLSAAICGDTNGSAIPPLWLSTATNGAAPALEPFVPWA